MSRRKLQIISTVLTPVLIALTAWIGGYDFDSRGLSEAYTFVVTIVATAAVWLYPGWMD